MTLRDWKIFLWALMHSPQQCLVEIEVVDFWFDVWDYSPTNISFSIGVSFDPQIVLHIPYETRRLYELKVEGVELEEIDEIPF